MWINRVSNQCSCWWSSAKCTSIKVCYSAPVCFPDVENFWIWHFFSLCLGIQKVEKVLDGQWGPAVRQSPDTPEQILHKRMDCYLVDTMSTFFIYIMCIHSIYTIYSIQYIIKCICVSVILTLVESSLVRYISLNFSALFSGCLLGSVSISGST